MINWLSWRYYYKLSLSLFSFSRTRTFSHSHSFSFFISFFFCNFPICATFFSKKYKKLQRTRANIGKITAYVINLDVLFLIFLVIVYEKERESQSERERARVRRLYREILWKIKLNLRIKLQKKITEKNMKKLYDYQVFECTSVIINYRTIFGFRKSILCILCVQFPISPVGNQCI